MLSLAKELNVLSNDPDSNNSFPDLKLDGNVLSNVAYRAILDTLFRGELQAGDTISEVSFARSLKVSRTPVHAAVRDLIRDGLLEHEVGRRPCVSRITRDDLSEIFDMRCLLEGDAAFRAAEGMDRQTMQRLEADLDSLKGRPEDADLLVVWCRIDDAFHEAIAISCNNKRLASDILRYRRVHHALNSIRMQSGLVARAADEHRAILRSLADRNREGARHNMQLHLKEWQAYYVRQIPLRFEGRRA